MPSEHDWLKAADILKRLRRREHADMTTVRELAFDVLIALSARNIDAAVSTTNRIDVPMIDEKCSFYSCAGNNLSASLSGTYAITGKAGCYKPRGST